MSKVGSSAFPWFKIELLSVANDLNDVKSLEGEGAYFRMLRHLWLNGPQTKAEIERRCKQTFGELEHVFSVCSTDVEQLLSIRWLEDQRNKAETGREKWRKAGVASAEARRAKSKKRTKKAGSGEQTFNERSTNDEKTLNECSTDVEHSTSTSTSISTSISSVSNSEKERAGAKDPRFEALWVAYDRFGSKGKALEYWKKLSEEDRAVIEAKAPEYVKSTPGGEFRYNLEGWINPAERRWERPIRVRSDQKPTASDRHKATIAPRNSKLFNTLIPKPNE